MFNLHINPLKSSLFIGASLALATSMSNAAAAFDLDFTGEAAPPTDEKIFEWQGRAGAIGFQDWEFGIGRDGTDTPNFPTSVIYYDWQNAVPIPWSIDYTQATGEAIFTINNSPSISYINTDFANQPLRRIGYDLVIRQKDGDVEPVTSFVVDILEINGESINLTPSGSTIGGKVELPDSNTSEDEISKFFAALTSEENITSITGTILMDWDTPNPNEEAARSNIHIAFKGYGPEDPGPEDIPEPSAVLGLLALGGLGFLSRSKKNNG